MTEKLFPSKTLVIIDAGHGIDTAGKRSPVWADGTQLREYKYNRLLAEFFSQYLDLAEISHIVLQNDDVDTPLSSRVATINSLYVKHKSKYFVYLVSLHGNAADGAPSANGIEVFTSKGETKSDAIATKYFDSLSTLGWKMRTDTSDGDADKEDNFYILKNTNCPAILTENGFYTNKNECDKMNDYKWQKKIAMCHFNGAKAVEFDIK
jgi:N-acetylmuramoyl-L-alanine amidase